MWSRNLSKCFREPSAPAARVLSGAEPAELANKADLDRLYLGRQIPALLVVARLSVELDATPEEMLAGIDVDPEEVRSVARSSRIPRGAGEGD